MLLVNFKPKRTAAASRGFLATARLSCLNRLPPSRTSVDDGESLRGTGRRHRYRYHQHLTDYRRISSEQKYTISFRLLLQKLRNYENSVLKGFATCSIDKSIAVLLASWCRQYRPALGH